jgi:uncharacterized membrane protein
MAEDRDKPEDLKPPTLLGEIRDVTQMFLKVAGVLLAVAAAVFPIFAWNQTAGIVTLYAMIFAGMIGFYAWQSYQWKRKEFERNRNSAKARAEWELAQSKLRGDKTA